MQIKSQKFGHNSGNGAQKGIEAMISRYFNDHLASVDETYFEHMGVATTFSARMFVASLACPIHAILPFMFVRTGSAAIETLHDRMVANRRRQPEGRLAARASH